MSQFDEIKQPILNELRLFETKFRDSMKTEVPLLDTIMNYIVKRKGKQIRPVFVMYCARLTGAITEKTYRGASLVELLHTATLVHDDVVDDSELRRGFFSINALWKNKIAVLVGDYLLSKGLLLSVEHEDFDMLKIVSNAVREMSEGELLQIEKARRLDITEDIYFDVIRKKTASLIASCCSVGAISGGADLEKTEIFRKFGEKIGIAFQIKDDILDLELNDTGKPHGIDIRERKLTLPIIYLLKNTDNVSRRRIINTIKNNHTDRKKVDEIIIEINHSGGIEYARVVMDQLIQEAINLLSPWHHKEDWKQVENLVQFIINRNH